MSLRVSVLSACVVCAVGVGLSAPASAQYYGRSSSCNEIRQDRGAAGAAIGGLIGGVVGGDLAGDGVTTEGVILGAAVGALVGNELGEDSVDCGRGGVRVVDHRGGGRHGRHYGHGRGSGYGYGHGRSGRYGNWGYYGYPHGLSSSGHGGSRYSFSFSTGHPHGHSHSSRRREHSHGYGSGYGSAGGYYDPSLQYGYFGNWNQSWPYGDGDDRDDDWDERDDDWDDDDRRRGPTLLGGPGGDYRDQCQRVQRQTVLPGGRVVTERVRVCLDRYGNWVVNEDGDDRNSRRRGGDDDDDD